MKATHPPVEVLWCGNSRKGHANGWSFPARVRRHLEAECAGKSVLHLFGGRSKFGTRMDIDPITRPDVIADAWMPPFRTQSFDVVILDPPYVHINAQMKTALFRAAGWIARERVIWFSTIWMAGSGGLFPEKAFLVRVGDSCYVRCLQYFTVRDRRGPVKHFARGPQMRYNKWLAGCMPLPFDRPLEVVA
jgi:hypothetical protein